MNPKIAYRLDLSRKEVSDGIEIEKEARKCVLKRRRGFAQPQRRKMAVFELTCGTKDGIKKRPFSNLQPWALF